MDSALYGSFLRIFIWFSLFFCGRFHLVYHASNLLRVFIKLEKFHACFPTTSGLLVGTMRCVPIILFLEYFTLLHGVSRAMHQACFITIRPIAFMDCIIFLALASAAILGVGRWVVSDPLSFPAMTGTVGICPVSGCFRRCYYFVDLPRHIHTLKYITCILVVIPPKVPYLYIGLILPDIRNGVY